MLCPVVYNAVHGTAPDYLSELCRSNILDSGKQPVVISRFHDRRPTLVISRLQSLGQRHETDYQQQSGHLTLCSFFHRPLFLFHSSRMQAPFNWTPILRRLRNYCFIIIIITLHSFTNSNLAATQQDQQSTLKDNYLHSIKLTNVHRMMSNHRC